MNIDDYTFVCWGDEKYDLTAGVKAETSTDDSTSTNGSVVANFAMRPAMIQIQVTPPANNDATSRIVLACPNKHTTVFLIPVPPDTPTGVIRGDVATPTDTFWQESVQQLTPDKSTEALQSQAKWVFSTIGTVGTVLTGFTLITAERLQAAPPWLTIPTVVLTMLSLVFAALALVPFLGFTNAANMTQVAKFWNHELIVRGFLVRVAGVLFALALGSAGAVAIVVATQPPSEAGGISTLKLTGTGDSESLSTEVDLSNLPAGATVDTKVEGIELDGTVAPLLTDQATADSTGSVNVSGDIPEVSTFQRFTVTSTVTSEGKTVRTETATLSP